MSLRAIRARLWVSRHIRAALRPGSLVAALIVAGYAATQLLKNEGVPSETAWKGHSPLNLTLIILGVAALLLGALLVWAYNRELRKSDKADELLEICKGAWVVVVRSTTIPFDDVGVHVWALRGFLGMQYLDRRASFVVERPRPTPIIWQRGKGAIGLAWELDDAIVADVEALEQQASDEHGFLALPRDERFGLTWRELRRVRHYRAVLAIPLRSHEDEPRVLGCFSVDVQVDGKAGELDNLYQANHFGTILSVCEAVLGAKR